MGLVARNKAVLLSGAVLTVLTGIGIAHAQEVTDSDKKPRVTVLQRLLLGSGGAQEPTDVPAAVSEVSPEQLDRFGRQNLNDTMRSVPGTFTRENTQQPGVAVNIRGFEGSGRVNSMIDGVRQNFRFTGHEASGFTYVDPNFLAGVDVARGAVSTMGGGGLAGSVNFRTIGVDDVVREGQRFGLLGRSTAGSNGVGFSGMIAGGMKEGSFGFTAALSGRSSQDYRNGDGFKVANTGQDLQSGLFKAEFGIGEDQKLSLGGILYHNDFAANSYYQTINNRTATLNYSYDPSDNDLVHLKVNGYYNNIRMAYKRPITPSPFAASAGRVLDDIGVGFDVSNTSKVDFGKVQWKSVNGVEYFHDSFSGKKTGVNPADGNSYGGAVFSENTFTYGIFDLIGALRYDFYGLDGSADAGPTSGGAYTVDQSKGSLNPKVTLAVNPTDWIQPYVTYSHSQRAPTLQETMLGGDHPGATSASFVPNPSLLPESQRGWELGVNIKHNGLLTADDSLRVKADYFDMRVEDFITSRTNPTFGKMQFVNLPGATHQKGFELSANYDAGFAFTNLAYTHTDTDLPSLQPGLGAISYLPNDIVSFTLGGRFFEQKLTAGARISYVSNTIGFDFAEPVNTVEEAGYTLTDLFASYKLTDEIDVDFKVTNLFDKQYTPALSTIGTGQGRTYYVGTQFQF